MGAPYTSAVYAKEASWLCRPDTPGDECHKPLDATIVNADGTTRIEPFVPAVDPPIDCFYVYPTVSTDNAANSDMVADEQEHQAVRNQAARLRSQCRLFAPIYRQVTLGKLFNAAPPAPGAEDPGQIAYGDVLDAWKHYLANDNRGRGVVLIGHSQGTGHLDRLLREEFDKFDETRSLLVSALLIGGGVKVPAGADIGGDFTNIGLCRSPSQFGCVVAYSTFRSTAPPPANSLFGRPRSGDGKVACVNPAALTGGPAELSNYSPTDKAQPFTDPARTATITTPYVSLPGLLKGECVDKNGFTYLELTVQGDPADPRVDDIKGDLTPEWGLHVVDVNIAMGDLVKLVAHQREAYQKAH